MIYGMKNVKWLEEIEVVGEDYQGYWMQRGWSDEAIIHTGSRIDVAGKDRKASMGSATWIAGVAWAGGRGISKVEVSTDDGETWDEAMLKEPISRYSWTLWAYRWTPDTAGRVSVVCRVYGRRRRGPDGIARAAASGRFDRLPPPRCGRDIAGSGFRLP